MIKKIILYGCGVVGKEALDFFGDMVTYFCDSRKDLIGERRYGKEVISLAKLKEICQDYILIISTLSGVADEIVEALEAKGIDDFLLYSMFSREELREMTAEGFAEKYSNLEQRRIFQRNYYKDRSKRLKIQFEYLKKHVDITSLTPATGYFRKYQMDQIAFANEFFEFIKELDIKPFLIAGGLIGVIRHNGFVPWDDDLDFGLMRQDYEKLLKFCNQNCVTYVYDGDWETYCSGEKPDKRFAELVRSHSGEWLFGMTISEAWVEKLGSFMRTSISFWPFDFYQEDYTLEEHNHYLSYIEEKRKEIQYMPEIIRFQREELEKNNHISKEPTSKIQPGIDNGLWCSRYKKGSTWIRTEDVLPLKRHGFEQSEFFVPNHPEKFLEYEYPNYMEFPHDFAISSHIEFGERYARRNSVTVEFYICETSDLENFMPLYKLLDENRIYVNFVLEPRERDICGGRLEFEGAVRMLDADSARYSESCNQDADFLFLMQNNSIVEEYRHAKIYITCENRKKETLDEIVRIILETGQNAKK